MQSDNFNTDATGYDTSASGGEFNNCCAWCGVTITSYADISTSLCEACRFHQRDNKANW